MCLLTGHFLKLKSVIFLLCNLEGISSNFIPVKFSGHMVSTVTGHCSDNQFTTQVDVAKEGFAQKLGTVRG